MGDRQVSGDEEECAAISQRRHVATAAASAASTGEFFARLDQAGVMVHLRYSVKSPGQVTGYAVALPGDTTKTGEPVWYGGGKLAADPELAPAVPAVDPPGPPGLAPVGRRD